MDALAFGVPLTLYVASSSQWPQRWDTGEMQVVPYILGIAHATGFPLFVLVGWLFTHTFVLGSVAWRMNVLCALFMAGAALSVRRLALQLGAWEIPSLAAALTFGLTEVAWNKGSHADVHTLALLLSLVVFLAVMQFAKTGDVRSIVLAAAAYGLGVATHPTVLWCGLALVPGLVSLARRSPAKACLVVAAAVAPLSLYAYLPIRSAVVERAHVDLAAAPPFNWHGEVAWDNNRPSTLAGFFTEVSGSQFGAAQTLTAFLNVRAYPSYAVEWYRDASKQLTVVTLLLAALGLLSLLRAPPRVRAGGFTVLAGAFAVIPFAYSYGPEMDVTRYLLPSLALTAAFAGAASEALALPAARWVARVALVAVMSAVPWHLYSANQWAYGARLDRGGQPVIDQVRSDVPDGSVVLFNWIDGTAAAYGAYVDRTLGHRIVLLWTGSDAGYYPPWAKRYRVFVYANFANMSEVPQLVPSKCLHEFAAPEGDHKLFEIRCPR